MEEANFNFCLKDGSPCIGIGVYSDEVYGIWFNAPNIDFEGNPGSDLDMGAYEND